MQSRRWPTALNPCKACKKNMFDLLLSDIVMSELDGIALALTVSRD